MNSASPMVGADVLGRQWKRYGDIATDALRFDPVYTEDQCKECPHEHICCNLVVGISPYEGLGIMSWLKTNVPGWKDVLDRVKMRAEAMQAFLSGENGAPRFADEREAHAAWFKHGLKCVFYDRANKNCSIYPVRPMTCRKAFGNGDCSNEAEGVVSVAENPQLMDARAARVRVGELESTGQKRAEMCSLITALRTPGVTFWSTPEDQKLMHTWPDLLTDDQVLWGLGARPMDNPWTED